MCFGHPSPGWSLSPHPCAPAPQCLPSCPSCPQGIYFTSNLEKASHFGDTILVCEVLTGKEKVVHEADYELNGLKLRASGHDSVYAPAGCGGNVFDEVLDREEGPAAGRDMNSIGAPCPVHINGEGR